MSNSELTSLAEMYQSGHLTGGISLEKNNDTHFESLRQEIRDLPKRMPKTVTSYDPIRKAVVDQVRSLGRKDRFIHKNNRLF